MVSLGIGSRIRKFILGRYSCFGHVIAGNQKLKQSFIVGVDFEEAGEKWRAGDAQKAARFFTRALGKYSLGLDRFHNSFDLAYNK